MTKSFKYLSIIASFVLLQGCSSGLMKPSESGMIGAPENDMATVVFMRSSFVASAIGVEVFEIEDGKMEFVGALPNGNKIAHKTTPGHKVYMTYGTAADFMIADVEGGKTYYSIVRPNWATGGFAPTPIRADGSTEFNTDSGEFMKWKNGTKLLEKNAEAKQWFVDNQKKYKDIYEDYWKRFQNKSEDQIKERTLNPSDGL